MEWELNDYIPWPAVSNLLGHVEVHVAGQGGGRRGYYHGTASRAVPTLVESDSLGVEKHRKNSLRMRLKFDF